MIPTVRIIRMMVGINEFVQIENVLKDRFNLIDVNRTIRRRLTQRLPFTQVPFECIGMDVAIFGSDVVVNRFGQRDNIGFFEGNGQLVRHLRSSEFLLSETKKG